MLLFRLLRDLVISLTDHSDPRPLRRRDTGREGATCDDEFGGLSADWTVCQKRAVGFLQFDAPNSAVFDQTDDTTHLAVHVAAGTVHTTLSERLCNWN